MRNNCLTRHYSIFSICLLLIGLIDTFYASTVIENRHINENPRNPLDVHTLMEDNRNAATRISNDSLSPSIESNTPSIFKAINGNNKPSKSLLQRRKGYICFIIILLLITAMVFGTSGWYLRSLMHSNNTCINTFTPFNYTNTSVTDSYVYDYNPHYNTPATYPIYPNYPNDPNHPNNPNYLNNPNYSNDLNYPNNPNNPNDPDNPNYSNNPNDLNYPNNPNDPDNLNDLNNPNDLNNSIRKEPQQSFQELSTTPAPDSRDLNFRKEIYNQRREVFKNDSYVHFVNCVADCCYISKPTLTKCANGCFHTLGCTAYLNKPIMLINKDKKYQKYLEIAKQVCTKAYNWNYHWLPNTPSLPGIFDLDVHNATASCTTHYNTLRDTYITMFKDFFCLYSTNERKFYDYLIKNSSYEYIAKPQKEECIKENHPIILSSRNKEKYINLYKLILADLNTDVHLEKDIHINHYSDECVKWLEIYQNYTRIDHIGLDLRYIIKNNITTPEELKAAIRSSLEWFMLSISVEPLNVFFYPSLRHNLMTLFIKEVDSNS
ncbi:hypothetical protein NEOKW01_0221 [Nematocida sp. AWRm80]|nr:hypothetical protein NEOKW01_0221 [Nematocida sp. AWRm80]